MTEKEKAAMEAQAKQQLHGPPNAIGTFIKLLDAFLSGTEIGEAKDLYIEKGDEDEDVRSRLSLLRKGLARKIFRLPDLRQYEFSIPSGQPYRLEKAQSVKQSLLWAPHNENGAEILIHTYERLFFRQNSRYVRDLGVNHLKDIAKITDFLKCPPAELSPTMHYVSSGEIASAIVLQQFFVSHCHKAAALSTGNEVDNDKLRNLILLGSARLDAPEMASPPHEKYRIVDGGIREGKAKQRLYLDKPGEENRQIVYVLMSRRQSDRGNSVQSVFEGAHGRAIQGVCQALTDKNDYSLCIELADELLQQNKLLPTVFQAVFRVDLISRPDFVDRAFRVKVALAQAYFPDDKAIGQPAG